jgi:hypothetical protein
VAPKARRVERLEFSADEASEILGYMTLLAQAGDGWINLLPNTAVADKPTTLGFFTLFGGGSLGVTMCTWIPGRDTRRGRSATKLGFSFSTGRRFGSELPTPTIPENWAIEQDHPRRGLILTVPFDESHELVLAWALRALEALSPAGRRVGSWLAQIYLPAGS